MILVDQLVHDIRESINEPNPENSFYTNGMILSAINRVLLHLNREVMVPQAILMQTLAIGTQEIALPDEVQNVISVKLNDRILDYFTYATYLEEYKEPIGGEPSRFYLREHYDDSLGDSVLALGFDVALTKAFPVEIQAVIYPAHIESLSDTIAASREMSLAIQNAVLAEMYDKDSKNAKASYHRSQYLEEVAKLKGKHFNRVPEYVR